MIIVSDTSPPRYLAVAGCLELLPTLYGTVICPEQVRQEASHVHAPDALRELFSNLPIWLRIDADPPIPQDLEERLDAGEASAIALAELLSADALLMDERKGRRMAESRGLAVAGTLNVLADAGVRGLPDYHAVVAQLRQNTNFRVRDNIIQAAWVTALHGISGETGAPH